MITLNAKEKLHVLTWLETTSPETQFGEGKADDSENEDEDADCPSSSEDCVVRSKEALTNIETLTKYLSQQINVRKHFIQCWMILKIFFKKCIVNFSAEKKKIWFFFFFYIDI